MILVLHYLVLVLSLGTQQTAADANLDRLAALHEQAAIAQNTGDYEEAERFHRMAIDTMGKIPDFPLFQQARMYSNLASVLNLRGNADEALPFLNRAQDLLEQDPPRDFTQASTLHFNLSRTYALTGQLTEAEDEHQQGMEILETNGAQGGILLADADAKLAYIYGRRTGSRKQERCTKERSASSEESRGRIILWYACWKVNTKSC